MPQRGSTRNLRAICLTGFMGAGKSTVGRLLARQMGCRFLDLDDRIESRTGLAVSAIFDRLGEPAFRQMEHEALVHVFGEIAERDSPAIVALGGGTFAQPASIALIREAACPVVWLQCSTETLLNRCAVMTNRPLFRDEISFLNLYQQRLPFYEQADYRVDGDGEPGAVAEKIRALGILEKVTA